MIAIEGFADGHKSLVRWGASYRDEGTTPLLGAVGAQAEQGFPRKLLKLRAGLLDVIMEVGFVHNFMDLRKIEYGEPLPI